MRKILSVLLASTYLTFAPLAAVADEAEMKAQVAEISAGLVERLPMDQKIVLKALSPEQSGLPEDFLRKLTSDLEAALLVASEFNINLANRLSTKELWSEATEFGDADFENLYAASQADIMLMLTPRATGAGVEISITAYRLLGDEAGQVIASSGSVVLAMDMESSLGVDVNSLNDQMGQVLAEIEKVGQTGGLITSPNTYAEYYHNARILQQRGETDLAIANYERITSSEVNFYDAFWSYKDLVASRYGTESLEMYFAAKLEKTVPDRWHSFVKQIFSNSAQQGAFDYITNLNKNPTELSIELDKLISSGILASIGTAYPLTYIPEDNLRLIGLNIKANLMALSIRKALRSGSFERDYIDPVDGFTRLNKSISNFSEVQLDLISPHSSAWSNSKSIVLVSRGANPYHTKVERIYLFAKLDTSINLEICGLGKDEKTELCLNVTSATQNKRRFFDTFEVSEGVFLPPYLDTDGLADGFTCITDVKYTDTSGNTYSGMPIIVARDDISATRNAVPPPYLGSLLKCAGKNFYGKLQSY